MRRTLLLTDVRPCSNFAGGLLLADMCRALPQEQLACFCMETYTAGAEVPEDLQQIPVRTQRLPRPMPRFRLGTAFLRGAWQKWQSQRALPRILEFAREQQVEQLWCLLQSFYVIDVVPALFEALQLPLHVQVMDPPKWWCRAHRLHPHWQEVTLRRFDQAVQQADTCAVASPCMAVELKQRLGVESLLMMPSLHSDWAVTTPPQEDEFFTIGLAGQVYAVDAFTSLVTALDTMKWQIRGKPVRIRIHSLTFQKRLLRKLSPMAHDRVQLAPWLQQRSLVQALSKLDLLYCPYFFDPSHADVAEQSFPSKLVAYMAAGRPILFHGPPNSGAGQFMQQHGGAHWCQEQSPSAIAAALEQLADPTYGRRLTRQAAQVFRSYFTMEQLGKNARRFLGESTYPAAAVA